jgi:protein-tyrosine phosphatase
MKRGILFRSNRIEVSVADLGILQGLGLTAIHDLRETHEIKRHPNTPVPGAKWHHHEVPGLPIAQVQALSSADDTYAAMLENYRTFVSDRLCRKGFADLLTTLVATDGPQLFHCSAGKDRTGWATALLHHIVGIDRDSTISDYLLTDEYAVASRQASLDSFVDASGSSRAHVYEPAFRCDTLYLDAAFAEADRLYGDLDGYLRNGLGLGEPELNSIRNKLVC